MPTDLPRPKKNETRKRTAPRAHSVLQAAHFSLHPAFLPLPAILLRLCAESSATPRRLEGTFAFDLARPSLQSLL
jgi:hypothetical protein